MRVWPVVGVFILGCGLCARAADKPISVAEAREVTADAVAFLADLNESAADDYFHTGEWDKTVKMLDRAIELRPTSIDPYATAAWLLFSGGKHDAAQDYYRRMIAANPKNPEAYFITGFYFFNRKMYPEALPYIEQAVKLGLESPKRHILGHLLVRLDRIDDAIAFWEQDLKEDPTDEVAKHELDKLRKQKAAPETPKPETPKPGTPAAPNQ